MVDPQRPWLASIHKGTFAGTGIKIMTEGKRHLGAAIGSDNFRIAYSTEKIKDWCKEIEALSEIAKTEPQAAFAA